MLDICLVISVCKRFGRFIFYQYHVFFSLVLYQLYESNLHDVGKYYSDVFMSVMASQITRISTVSRLFRHTPKKTSKLRVSGRESIGERWLPHKGSITRKMFPLDNVFMFNQHLNTKTTKNDKP